MTHTRRIEAEKVAQGEVPGGDRLLSRIHRGDVLCMSPSIASLSLRAAVERVVEQHFTTLEGLRRAYEERVLRPWLLQRCTSAGEVSRRAALPFTPWDPRRDRVPNPQDAPSRTAQATDYFAQLRTLRAALQIDPGVCAAIVELMTEIGLGRASTRVDAVRLRVHAGDAHRDPFAAAAFTAHRDTWYANPTSQLNLWMPLHEVQAEETFQIYPTVLSEPVVNDSAGFDYDEFVTRVGFQGRPAGAIVYPSATDPAQLEGIAQRRTIVIQGPAGSVFAFSAAHLHQPCAHHGLLARLSLDLRVVDLDAERAGRGPAAVDRACKGRAQRDYLSLDELSARTRSTVATGDSSSSQLAPAEAGALDPGSARIADLIARLEHWAAVQPDRIAMTGTRPLVSHAALGREGQAHDQRPRSWTWRALAAAVAMLSAKLAWETRETAHADATLDGRLVPRVALVLQRGPGYVIALLACFRAGLAAVPVDPSQPEPRARTIFRTAAPCLVLHEGLDQAHWSATLGIPRVDLLSAQDFSAQNFSAQDFSTQDFSAQGFSAQDFSVHGKMQASVADEHEPDASIEPCPAAKIHAHNLAYLIFTSGSTGDPKGVAVAHRDLGALWSAQTRTFQLGRSARVLWMLSPSFDASISDIGCALWAGARLDVLPASFVVTPDTLCSALREHDTTHVDLPPRIVAALGGRKLPGCVRTVIVGGEASDPAILASLARDTRVIAVYGPTEATVCTHLVEVDPLTWRQPAIGSPRPGVRERIVALPSRHRSSSRAEEGPTAAIQGELWLSGACLALGYLEAGQGEPRLQEDAAWPADESNFADDDADGGARFVQHQGERWYRTGDVVARQESGELVFLSRRDRQLKIAGRLIAPEEIEQVVARGLGRACLAYARSRARADPTTGEPRKGSDLELGLVLEGDPARAHALASEARAAIAAALPRWMLPTHVHVVATLPRGASDKVDPVATQQLVQASEKQDRRAAVGVGASDHVGRRDPKAPVLAHGSMVAVADANPEADDEARERLGPRASAVMPRDELERALLGALRAVTDHRPASLGHDLLDEQGLSSIELIEFVAQAELRGLPLTLDILEEGRNLQGIAALLREEVARDRVEDPSRHHAPPGAMSRAQLDTYVDREFAIMQRMWRRDRTRCSQSSRELALSPTARSTSSAAMRRSDRAARDTFPRQIFLTGATGFLGSHLLVALLGAVGGPSGVTCLLRGHSQAQARTRLGEALTRYGLDPALAQDARVEIVVGDLESLADQLERASEQQPGDGDTEEGLQSVIDAVQRADLLIHGAAQVHLTKSFIALAPTNLAGTRAILQLWQQSEASLLYISTLSVFVASDRSEGAFAEDDELEPTRYILGGYAQTKWAAERLVRRVAAATSKHAAIGSQTERERQPTDMLARQNARLTIARLGLLTGHSEHGAAPEHDLLVLTARGLAGLGVYPTPISPQLAFDLSPVDVVADALSFLALRAPSAATMGAVETLHLAAAQGCSLSLLVEVVDELLQSQALHPPSVAAGLVPIDAAGWEAALLLRDSDHAPLERAAAYLALSRAASNPGLRRRHRALDLLQATQATFVATQARRALEGWSGAWPTDPRAVLRVAVRSALHVRMPTESPARTQRYPAPTRKARDHE